MRNGFKRSFGNPVGRWAAVGPYYAMFPLEFAFRVVATHSEPGELVIDPFAGRASSIYAAATQGRTGLGVEINPLGWVYAKTKLGPSSPSLVKARLENIVRLSCDYLDEAAELPDFFHWCYSRSVRAFLLAARANLNWKRSQVDRTLMTFLLIYLHGKLGEGLSNQMRLTKAMGPIYSVRWWKARHLRPPEVDCREFLLSRISWRYEKGVPDTTFSTVKLGDSAEVLGNAVQEISRKTHKRCSLLFTSPPYQGVTDYHKDQWLRLWLLGGPNEPFWVSQKYKGRFESKVQYHQLLDRVFKTAAHFMSKHATVYVRTDSREFSFATTREILRKHFPRWKERIKRAPVSGRTQTDICGNKSSKCGEIDIILTR